MSGRQPEDDGLYGRLSGGHHGEDGGYAFWSPRRREVSGRVDQVHSLLLALEIAESAYEDLCSL